MQPQSEIVATSTGFVLNQGRVRVEGRQDIRLSKADLRPATAESILQVQFTNHEFTVDVRRGSASLVNSAGERYSRLDAGTHMLFVEDPGQPLGLTLDVTGCVSKHNDDWYLHGEHIPVRMQLLGGVVRKPNRRVQVRGKLLPIVDPQVAARIEVASETDTNRGCRSYTPFIIAGAAGSAAAAVIVAVPGGDTPPVSVP